MTFLCCTVSFGKDDKCGCWPVLFPHYFQYPGTSTSVMWLAARQGKNEHRGIANFVGELSFKVFLFLKFKAKLSLVNARDVPKQPESLNKKHVARQ